MSEVFLENPRGRKAGGKRRPKQRTARRNGPELMLFGNPRGSRSKSKSGGASMAKKRKGRKSRKRSVKVLAVAKPSRKRRAKSSGGKKRRSRGRRAITLRRTKSAYRKSGRSFTKTRGSIWANPVAGFVRIPSTQELTAVAIGALALPAISKLVKGLPLPEIMRAGWGGIATELLIGSVASVAARRFVGSGAGDVIFTLTLARGVQNIVRQVAPSVADQIGLADGGLYDDGSLEYQDTSLGYVDPVSTSGMNDGGMPEMV